jgi:hypothetical protein
MKHGQNTDTKFPSIRVHSVFHPWLLLIWYVVNGGDAILIDVQARLFVLTW